MKKLLFVCLGNICRSPAAEGIMQQKVTQSRLKDQVYCDSAGTSGLHLGDPADARMTRAAKKRGYELLSRSRPVALSDFSEFDLILAMDRSNEKNLKELCPSKEYLKKIVLMCNFCQQFKESEVPDPYYGGESGFEFVIDLLEDACDGLLKNLEANKENV